MQLNFAFKMLTSPILWNKIKAINEIKLFIEKCNNELI